jgi:hypothetical protein
MTEEVNQEAAVTEEAVTESVTSERPEWLPEKFWVDDAPSYENLAKSYSELEKMRGNMKEAVAQEFEAQRIAQRPEAATDYKLPESENLNSEQLAASPIVEWWRGFAHEQGYNQEQFENAINNYAQVELSRIEESYKQEMAQLGENAEARIEAVSLWMNNTFDEAQREALADACTSASGVAAVEKIIDMLKATGNVDEAAFEKPPEVTREEVEKMMQDRRYWHPADRDPAFVKKVEDFFSKSFGQ